MAKRTARRGRRQSAGPLKPRRGKDEALLVDLLNSFHAEGLVPAHFLTTLRDSFDYRVDLIKEQLRKQGPDVLAFGEEQAFIARIEGYWSIIRYETTPARLVLYETDTGHEIAADEIAFKEEKTLEKFLSKSSVQLEIFAEVVLATLGIVAALPDGAAKKVKEWVKRIFTNPRIRSFMEQLLKLLSRDRYGRPPYPDWVERLRKLLKEFFEALWEDLKQLLKDIWAGLSLWSILGFIFDLLALITPWGWVKKAATISAAFVGLGLALGKKYADYQGAGAT